MIRLPKTRIGWLNIAMHVANGLAMAAPFVTPNLLPPKLKFVCKFLPGVASMLLVYLTRYRDQQAAELAAKNAYVWPVPGETYLSMDGYEGRVKANDHESDD